MAGDSGNFDSDYVTNRSAREAADLQLLRAQALAERTALEAQANAQATPSIPATPAAPAATLTVSPAAEEPAATDTGAEGAAPQHGVAADVAISAVDGVVDAVRNTASIIPDTEWQDWLKQNLDVQEESSTMAGSLVHGATQFATGFIPAVRAVRWAGIGAKVAFASAGAVSDFFTFDPHQARLSNLAVEAGWGLDNPLTQALMANPDDGEVAGRLKNAAEGIGLGAVTDGALRMAKWGFGKSGVKDMLARAASKGKIPVEVAAETNAAASRVTLLREQLNDLEVAEDLIRQADSKATDMLLAKQTAGEALSPEEAARMEAGQFRAGQSGEPLEDAVRAQGAGELSSLDEAAQTNPELVAKVRGAVSDGGSIGEAKNRLTKELNEAEEQYIAELGGLPRETAEMVAKRVDKYTTPATATRDAELAGRAKSTVEALEVPVEKAAVAEAGEELVSSSLRGGIRVNAAQEARVLTAIDEGAPVEHISDLWDMTNYGRIETGEDVEGLLRSLAQNFGDSKKSMRILGVQTLEETEDAARAILRNEAETMDTTEEIAANMFAKLLPGVKDLAAKVTAVRLFELSLAKEVTRLGKLVVNGLGGPEAKLEFKRKLTVLTNVNDLRSGVQSELGRGLGAQRIIAKDDVQMLKQQVEDILNEGPMGQSELNKAAVWWANGGDKFTAPQRRRHGLKTRGQKVRDTFVEYWINSILSGPITQVVNIGSNTAVGLYLPAEHLLGGIAQGNLKAAPEALHMYMSMIEGFRATLNLVDTFGHAKEAFGHIAKGDLRGAASSFSDALGAGSMGRTLKTGQLQTVGDMARQFDMPAQQAISAANYGMKHGTAARIVDALGTVINLPTRSLSTFDELAKGVNYHMQLGMKAYDAAAARGLSGQAAESFRKLIHNNAQLWHSMGNLEELKLAGQLGITPREVRGYLKSFDDGASQYARYATFTEALQKGTISRLMQKTVNAHPLFRFVAPFIRTPMNILKFMTERMPSQMIPGVRKIHWGAGGQAVRKALAEGGEARQAAISRVISGSALWTIGATAAYLGHVTGAGPKNPEERAMLEATGWQANSVAFTNDDGTKKYFSINRSDPFGGFLLLTARYAEIWGNADQEEMDSVAMDLALATSQMMLNKSYFVGLTGFMNAFTNTDRAGKSFAQRFIGSWVPAFLDQTQLFGGDEHDSSTAGRAIRDAVTNPNLKVGSGEGVGAGAATAALQLLDYMDQVISNRAHVGEGPPRRNIFGEVVAYPPGWGPDIASPFFTTTEMNEPIDQKIRELSAKGEGVRLDLRTAYGSIGTGDTGVRLDANQQEELIKLATSAEFFGETMREGLNSLVQRGDFPTDAGGLGLGQGAAVQAIEEYVTGRISQAEGIFMSQHPDVANEREALKTGAGMAAAGHAKEDIDAVMNSIRTR